VGTDVMIATLAERPELGAVFEEFADAWPAFMYHDQVSAALLEPLLRAHPESNLMAVHRDEPSRPIARACAGPYRWPPDRLDSLPVAGYDDVILRGTASLGEPLGTVAAAVEITVRPDWQGRGLSRIMLDALCRALAAAGYDVLVAPVRPNRKHEHPTESIAEYVHRTRPDGLPVDPWLRVHARAGGTVVGLAPASMIVSASLDAWREWTGRPFDQPGPVLVPYALVPVHCDPASGVATYVEPNVWMRHDLR
jgi:GNAT superfamily N-acetyltransferase